MWRLLPDDDQTMIADSVHEYLARELPIERLRPGGKSASLNDSRKAMAELGWFGIGLPEGAGGSGLGLVEEVLIQRECGRQLVSPGVLATVLAGHVALHARDSELASAFATGSTGAALAIPIDATAIALDWSGSDPLLLWNAEGIGLFGANAFLDARPEPCVDDSVSMQIGSLDFSRPRVWVPNGKQPLGLRADVLVAASMVGLAERACDLAVDYAKVREQFGKPIGSFQAIKHRCADMAVRHRLAWYQVCHAALKVQASAPDAGLQVASAKLLAAEAAHENGRAAIQIHGAIGFQAECDAHWFLKRAMIYDQLGGAMAEQARRVISEPAPGW